MEQVAKIPEIVPQELSPQHPQDRHYKRRRIGAPFKQYPQWRDRYGRLTVNHKVTLEDELAEIRARHEARREYNRIVRAIQKRQKQLRLSNAILPDVVGQSDD